MHNKDQIDLFFNAGLSYAKAKEMQSHILQCAECRAHFEASLEVDRALLTHGSRTSLTDGEWDALVGNALGTAQPASRLSDAEWNQSVTGALERARPERRIPFPFSTRSLFALAAGLLLVLGVFYLRRQTTPTTHPPQTALATQPVTTTEGLTPLSADKPVALGRGCVAIPASQAKLKIDHQTADETALRLESGAALFEVTHGAYHRFAVETPDAWVEVLGTRFSVWVQGGHTRVSVLRGRVRVRAKETHAESFVEKDQILSLDSALAGVRPLAGTDREALRLLVEALPPLAGTLPPVPVLSARADSTSTALSALGAAQLQRALGLADLGAYDSALTLLDGLKNLAEGNSTVEAAWYRAGLLRIKNLGRPRDGAGDLSAYLEKFPRGLYAEEAMVDLTDALRALGDQAQWLQYAEKFSTQFPAHPRAADLLYEAATVHRDSRKDFRSAAPLYENFLARYTSDVRAEDALFWLGACRQRLNDRHGTDSLWSKYDVDFPQGKWRKEIKSLRVNNAGR